MIYKGTRQSPFLLFTMDPEVQALIAVYQKRLTDATAQNIAFEARIIMLQKQIEELTTAPPPQPTPKTGRKASAKTQDGGKF